MDDRAVFINCSTEVHKSLFSHIYYQLDKRGLRAFQYEQELQAGYSLNPASQSAIDSASVRIAIFSPKYAESAVCLEVLSWMVISRSKEIIPIFYDIKPSDLENVAEGAYARAFQIHREEGVPDEQVNRWMEALKKVSDTSGLVFDTVEDYHGERLQQIVEIVLEKVRRVPLDVCEHPVGLDQAAQNFEELVSNQSESNGAQVIKIAGPAGSGKSTLAAYLFNSKRGKYMVGCFLCFADGKPLYSLQETLLKDLRHDQNVSIENTQRGKSMLTHRLSGLQRALIVFDDIKNRDQIDNLLFVKDILGNHSLILVTCEDQTLSLGSQVKTYTVKQLEAKDAQELFCWYAFKNPKPPHNLEDRVEQLVRVCGGLPMDLKRLAKDLAGEDDPSKWKRQLESLRKQRSKKWWRRFSKGRSDGGGFQCLQKLCH